MTRSHSCGIVIVALIGFQAVFATGVVAQTSSVADGPWSGSAQCVFTARSANYVDEQVHTWRLTGAPPRISGAFREWPAVWTVKGQGRREADTWTVTVPDTSAPIAIWEVPGTKNVRIGSRHGLLVAPQAVRVTGGSGGPGTFSLQEVEFPAADGPASDLTIAGTRKRETRAGPGWRKPSDVATQETCTWNFTRGRSTSSAPAPSVALAVPTKPAAPQVTEAIAAPTTSAPGARLSRAEPQAPATAATPPARGAAAQTRASGSSAAASAVRSETTSKLVAIAPEPTPAPPVARLNILVAPQSNSHLRAGDLFSMMVEVLMPDGTRDVAFEREITLSAAARGGSNFSFPVRANATAGAASFSAFLNDAANGYVITASAPGFASVVTASFNVTATTLTISNIAGVTAGAPFQVTATARDANNNIAENFTGVVTLTATPTAGAGGDFTANKTANAVGGVARFTVSLDKPAAYQVTASSAGLTGTHSNPFTVTAP